MKRNSSKALGKKIMLSLMVAGVMSSYAAGVVGATSISESYTAPGPVDLEQIIVTNGTVELMHGGTVKYEMTEDAPGGAVYISGESGSLTAKDVNFTGHVEAENGSSISLTGGSLIATPYYGEQDDGTIGWGGKTSFVVFDGAQATANNVNIQSAVEADGGKMTITGSTISGEEGIYAANKGEIEISGTTVNLTGNDFAEGIYAELGGKITISDSEVTTDYAVEASDEGSNITVNNSTVTGTVLANYGGSVTVNDSSVTGWVIADYEGANITLNGGSVIAAPAYKEDGVTPDGYTSITAAFGDFTTESGDVPTITATGVDIQSGVYATSGGKINIIDSNINTLDNIQAEGKESNTNTSIVISSTSGNNTYTAADISAYDGASVLVKSGKVALEQVYAERNGKVELLGGGTVGHISTPENLDCIAALVGEGSSLTANGIDFTGEVRVENGGSISLTGGSVIAGPLYKEGPDGTIIDGDTTMLVADGAGSTITADGANIQSDILIFNNAKVTLNNSNINAEGDIKVSDGSTLTISSADGTNTYTAHDISAGGDASLTINGGSVATTTVSVSGNSELKILGGGTITAEQDKITELTGKFTAVSASSNGTFLGQNLQIKGDVKAIRDSSITLTGGSIESIEKDPYSGNYQAIEANEGSSITGKDLTIKGSVYAHTDSSVTLTNGSIIGIEGANNLGEIEATDGGTVTLDNVAVKTSINAYTREDGEGLGTVVIKNSDVEAIEGFYAGKGGVIELNGGEKNTYTAADYILTEDGGKIYLNGGTLEADNLRALTHGIYEEESGNTIDSADDGIVLANNGKISTMTGQIFDTAAYDVTTDTVTGDKMITVDNTKIDYQGGTLIFNDAQYTDAYLTNAKDALLTYQPDSNTSIVMKGTLVDNQGNVRNEISVDDAVANDDMRETVSVTADKNLLVGSATFTGETHGIVIEDNVAKGFKAAVLNLGEGSDGMIITNNSKVTLGGGTITGDVLKVLQNDGTSKADGDLKVVVGTVDDIVGVTDKTATLNIGGGSANEKTVNQLTGSVTVNAGSTLTTTGQTKITGGVTLNGNESDAAELNVAAGRLITNITADGSATITGAVKADKLNTANASTVINIGNDKTAGNVEASNVELNGATVFLDPVWSDNGTISDASGLAVVGVEALDGNYIVGRNSLLSLGAERKNAEEVFGETGLTWGANGISAAAYVDGSINVKSGSLTVDGSPDKASTDTIAAGSIRFADQSLLMVNGANIYGEEATAAITGVTSATIDDGAKLQIANASQDGTYKILAGEKIGTGWLYDETDVSKQNIGFTNQLMGVESIEKADGYFNVIGESLSVRNKYGDAVVIADVIDDARANYPDSAAAKFFNSAVDSTVNTTKAQQIGALNNAAAMSELAGVSHATYSASNILTNAVADHMSLARSIDHDTDIWAHYVHNKENIDGLSVANGGAVYDAQYNGIVVGADLYKQGKGTIGAALTYIDGKVTGSTKNEAEYYGLSIYGGVQNEDSAVIGDISYLHGKNEITQNNSGYTLTGEPKSDAFSVGVRAEQSFKAGAGKFVPYAGLRYMHLGTGNYTNSIGLSYDADDANLFLLPVGVKYSAEHKSAGWTLRPIVEVGYVWAMGDRDGQQTVSLNGTSNGFGYDVTDSGSYIGRFVLEAEKANVTYGLGYEYQKGDSVKANKWMVNLNWNF